MSRQLVMLRLKRIHLASVCKLLLAISGGLVLQRLMMMKVFVKNDLSRRSNLAERRLGRRIVSLPLNVVPQLPNVELRQRKIVDLVRLLLREGAKVGLARQHLRELVAVTMTMT